jgi:AcrR family transcriptional regulator
MVQKRKSTGARKTQIIAAARKLIIRKGSEHLTVRAIAKEVEITEAAIYRHFKSKREILLFLMNHLMDSMLQEVETRAAGGSSAAQNLYDLVAEHLTEIEQRRGMSYHVIAEIISLGDKKLNREVYQKLQLYIERIQGLLQKGMDEGEIRPDIDPAAAALLLFGMIQGLVNYWALSNCSFDLARNFASLWNVYSRAVQPKSLPPAAIIPPAEESPA